MVPVEFESVADTRRTVHEYSDESIDRSTLDDIFEATTLSPPGTTSSRGSSSRSATRRRRRR